MKVMGATWKIREGIRHFGEIHHRRTAGPFSPDSLTPWTRGAMARPPDHTTTPLTASSGRRTHFHDRAIDRPGRVVELPNHCRPVRTILRGRDQA